MPQRNQKPSGYSSKVFLGGVPWDITESLLIATFKQFGQIRVEWPGKDQSATQPKGYVYIIFECEKQVRYFSLYLFFPIYSFLTRKDIYCLR